MCQAKFHCFGRRDYPFKQGPTRQRWSGTPTPLIHSRAPNAAGKLRVLHHTQ